VGFVSYAKLRANARDFEGLAVYARTEATVGRGADAHRVNLGRVSSTFFPLLGVRPLVGRFFGAEEDRGPRGNDVIVLDEGYWRRVYGGDRAAVGRTISIGGVQYTIIGISPAGFTGVELARRDAWVPISLPYWGPGEGWETAWGLNWLQIIGRLKPGVSLAQAGTDLTTAHQRAFDGPANDDAGDHGGQRRDSQHANVDGRVGPRDVWQQRRSNEPAADDCHDDPRQPTRNSQHYALRQQQSNQSAPTDT
jgi:hypothetical protein